jgi:hypothetical protein
MITSKTKSLLLSMMLLCTWSGGVFSAENIIGAFSGVAGVYAGTKTLSEAHAICLSEQSASIDVANASTSDQYNQYKQCMAKYTPFKDVGSDLPSACSAQSVTWGNCSALTGSSSNGDVLSLISDKSNGYEGQANFVCSNGELSYVSGTCQQVTVGCDSGLVQWDVTFPKWASPNGYDYDKYGSKRHADKEKCKALVPADDSGKHRTSSLDLSLMSDKSYSDGTYYSVCFNNERIKDKENVSSCNYTPKACKAKVYTNANGCGFNLPQAPHDTIFNGSVSSPYMAKGNIQAYCWDGEWEVKSATCLKGCSLDAPETTWDSSPLASKQCKHSAKNNSTMIQDGAIYTLTNETQGLEGSTVRSCNNGVLKIENQTCTPKPCYTTVIDKTIVSGGNVCQFKGQTSGGVFGDESTLKYTYRDHILNADVISTVNVKCELGEWVITGESCGKSESICKNSANNGGNGGNGGNGQSECVSGNYGNYNLEIGGRCCRYDTNGNLSCMDFH